MILFIPSVQQTGIGHNRHVCINDDDEDKDDYDNSDTHCAYPYAQLDNVNYPFFVCISLSVCVYSCSTCMYVSFYYASSVHDYIRPVDD